MKKRATSPFLSPGTDTGVDEAVKRIAKGLRLKTEEHQTDSGQLVAHRFRDA